MVSKVIREEPVGISGIEEDASNNIASQALSPVYQNIAYQMDMSHYRLSLLR
jgi:hypothetical protein